MNCAGRKVESEQTVPDPDWMSAQKTHMPPWSRERGGRGGVRKVESNQTVIGSAPKRHACHPGGRTDAWGKGATEVQGTHQMSGMRRREKEEGGYKVSS